MTGDPNVSALSSEVEDQVRAELFTSWPKPCKHIPAHWLPDEAPFYGHECVECVAEFVRNALGTVEKERDAKAAEARHNSEGLREYMKRWDASREQARALAEALRVMDAHYSASLDYQPPYVRIGRAALASWDTSQKESRG